MTTEHDNRVYIHAGKYKGRYGTYMGKYGKVMCSIRIDGDTVLQRNLWLTSITRIEGSNDNGKAKKKTTSDNDDVTVSRGELLEILETIEDMKEKIELLETKLQVLVINKN